MSELGVLSQIRLAAYLPIYAVQWYLLLSAREKEDWAAVESITASMHRHGAATGSSRLWHGTALLHLDRTREALEDFEAIDRLRDIAERALRVYNHALALHRLHRPADCRELLADASEEGWSESLRAKRVALEEAAREE